jgi:hypothetical protein
MMTFPLEPLHRMADCRDSFGALPTRQVVPLDWPHPSGRAGDRRRQAYVRRTHRPCHYRAIHNGRERSHADTHGQSHGRHDRAVHRLARWRPFSIWLCKHGSHQRARTVVRPAIAPGPRRGRFGQPTERSRREPAENPPHGVRDDRRPPDPQRHLPGHQPALAAQHRPPISPGPPCPSPWSSRSPTYSAPARPVRAASTRPSTSSSWSCCWPPWSTSS